MLDRREYQRLKLLKPILGTVDGQGALILDIGVGGAFIEHYGQTSPGDQFRLGFLSEGAAVEFVCEVRRSFVVRLASDDSKVSHTGARFVEAIGDSEALLEKMIASFISRILEAQRANARGERGLSHGEAILAHLGEAQRMRSRGCVTHSFADGRWTSIRTDSANQPDDGFTVAAFEDEEEVHMLRQAYETADAEGRRLIRLIADLSVHAAHRR
ncbi:MAG TPA: hypothetical protein VHU41_01020 [Thermoanaerobaculia bacterium]|jgi:hypothetical protein|nr:hypothetical protein [Thermoanaerobaculia bacterium]